MRIDGRIPIYFFAVAVLAAMAVPARALSRTPPDQAWLPGRVLVTFEEGVSRDRAEEIVEAEGCTVDRVLERTGIYLVLLPEGMEVVEALRRFKAHPEVRSVEPDYKAQPLGDER